MQNHVQAVTRWSSVVFVAGEAMCSRGFFTCVERGKKRRAGYEIKFAALDHEPGLVFCYGERALPSQDKDKPTLLFLHGLGTDKVSRAEERTDEAGRMMCV